MMAGRKKIQEDISLIIARLARVRRRVADRTLSAHGLSEATAHPLQVLTRHDESVRQGTLADEIGIEGPSLVRLIDLLEADGLVERREDPTDRRAKLLRLTSKGKTTADEINHIMQQLRADIFKEISTDELAITLEVLGRLEMPSHRFLTAGAETTPA